jgi:uncharacterized protein DUF6174
MTFAVRRTSGLPAEPPKELRAAQVRWGLRSFQQYEFIAEWRCLCPLPVQPVTFQVNGTAGAAVMDPRITQFMGLPPNAIAPILNRYGSIDRIFDLLIVQAARNPHLLKVEYDLELGYPRSILLKPSGIAVDDDIELKVTAFRKLQ